MIYSDKVPDVTQRPDLRGRCFTGLEIAAIAGAVGTVVSAGMSIAGASQQADAQRQAGEIAYQNALIRNQQMEAQAAALENQAKARENEARLRDQQANDAQAAAQREALEEKRKSQLAAGKAQAVMAASGAGVDTSLLAGILGEGDIAFDTALYEGDTKAQLSRYQGDLDRYDASLRRYEAQTALWSGQTGLIQGGAQRSAANAQADSTLTGGIAKGVVGLTSLASQYAPGPAPGYNLSADTLRTANDADLGGYSG